MLTDALGSTVAVSDTNGNLLTQHTYDPFGATVVQGDSGVSLRFTGREQDDSDSYYFRARYYQPNVGRFISEDPVDRDLNVYVYARSNPVTFVDRLGLKPG
ncbi:MAG TPA: RHS repeat-associated core domain-containing protein, partial [Gemmatimonadaceae bacterium]